MKAAPLFQPPVFETLGKDWKVLADVERLALPSWPESAEELSGGGTGATWTLEINKQTSVGRDGGSEAVAVWWDGQGGVDVDRSSGHPSETPPGTAGVVSTLEVILGDTEKNQNKHLPTDYVDVRRGPRW